MKQKHTKPLSRHARAAFIIAGVVAIPFLFWALVIPAYLLFVSGAKFVIAYIKEVGGAIAGLGVGGILPTIASMARAYLENKHGIGIKPDEPDKGVS